MDGAWAKGTAAQGVADVPVNFMSKLLPERLGAPRPLAVSRRGARLTTDVGEILEIAGGAHASCIVNDQGAILTAAVDRIQRAPFPCTSRSVRHSFQDELAERVVDLFGDPAARVYFTSGGTEAVETAARLAYHIQSLRGRRRASVIVGRTHSYHGMSLLARNIGHHPVHSALPDGLDFGWPKLPEPRCSDCPMQCAPAGCDLRCVDVLEDILKRVGTERVAAVIIEPVSGTTGAALVPPQGYIQRLSKLCRSNRILLIADETVTAFGRTGAAFATGAGLADIVVGGKCLGGGFAPVNAVILSSVLVDELSKNSEELPLRLTFAGNPLACVIATCAQEYADRRNLYSIVRQRSTTIGDGLAQLVRDDGVPAIISGIGHLWSVQVPVRRGDGIPALDHLRRSASVHGLEFMGGVIVGLQCDYVHLMFTPAFDITDPELLSGIEMTIQAVRRAYEDTTRSPE